MKPWLEDLSEEWIPQPTPQGESENPNPRTASQTSQSVPPKPRSRLPRLRNSSGSFSEIQVRHLAKNLKAAQKPRSALAERTASDNNAVPSSPIDASTDQDRSEFDSASAGSVVYSGTVAQKPVKARADDGRPYQNTPEWKKRLVKGDMGYGEQKDLFSPMGLENMFQKPRRSDSGEASKPKSKLGLFRGLSAMPSSPPPWPSDEEATGPANGGSVATRDDRHDEEVHNSIAMSETSADISTGTVENHPVPRTVSGQIEFENENFSPVYLTTNLKIGGQHGAVPNFRGSELAQRLRHLRSPQEVQGLDDAVASNTDVQRHGNSSFVKLQDDSFPEDLPAGTPDLAEVGRFVELRRGGYSRDGSFRRRPLSPSPQSKATSRNVTGEPIIPDISTPGHERTEDSKSMVVRPTAPSPPAPRPTTPHRPGPSKYLSPERQHTSGSPLKLFEAHDTFTSNRLHRRLSQLDLRAEKTTSSSAQGIKTEATRITKTSSRLTSVEEVSVQQVAGGHYERPRVGTFGQGQLDQYPFPEGFSELSSNSSEERESAPDDSPASAVAPPGSRQLFNFHSDDSSPKPRIPSTAKRQGLTRVSNPFRRLSRSRPSAHRQPSQSGSVTTDFPELEYAEGKRGPTSPFKDPTPKRRRTLFSTDGEDEGVSTEVALKPVKESHSAMQSVIGRKRKDARHEHSVNVADPDVLARRHILRPRNPTPSQRRRDEIEAEILEATEAFIMSSPKLITIREQLESPAAPDSPSEKVRAAVIANEVAAFSMKRVQAMKDDSRKRSVTTQDFLDEAVKIMDFIRNKGRPNSGLASLEETESEQAIDEEMDNLPSTPLTFSRPPSREGRQSQWREPNKRELDPQVMSHLRKFEEKESDDFIGSSVRSLRVSRMKGPASTDDNSIIVQQDNIRITDNLDRYHREIEDEDNVFTSQPRTNGTHPSTGSSIGQTVATNTSRRSDHVATLAPEAVAHLIPEQIAGMVFDSDKNIWVRQKSPSKEHFQPQEHSSAMESEEDPFGNIPDLTVDETVELRMHKASPSRPKATAETLLEETEIEQLVNDPRPVTREGSGIAPTEASSVPSRVSKFAWSYPKTDTRATSWSDQETRRGGTQKIPPQTSTYAIPESDEDDIEHEIKYFEGRGTAKRNHTVRDITISISSPRPLVHPGSEEQSVRQQFQQTRIAESPEKEGVRAKKTPWQHLSSARTLPNARLPPFRTNDDLHTLEEQPRNYRMQLSMSVQAPALTHGDQDALVRAPSSPLKGDMTFMLSELPDFTINQVDECELPDRVVVQHDGTKLSKALEDRYAQGTAELVKALQDAEPDEPYWEDLREVDLHDHGLTNLHRLDEFCYRLEDLNVSKNGISQVRGIPFTIRRLQAQQNLLTGLTNWSTLMNLQYLDISDNEIDRLDGLSHLVHLRTLRMDNNRVESLNGILELDGLMELSAVGNQLDSVDFSIANMKSLTDLNLRSNRLAEVRNLHCLPQLRHLDLDDNCIHVFPLSDEPKGRCNSLRSFRLSRNGTSSLDVDTYFPNIESLHVDGNCLAHVSGLEHLRHLRTFSAREQGLGTTSDAETCVGNLLRNPDVRNLYISVNPTRSLDLSQHLLNLQKLELASMGLKELPDSFGQLTPNLRSVNLNFNSLKDLRPLLNIKRLSELLVAGNKLQRLRTNLAVLGKLTTLTNLDLRENPLTLRFYAPTVENRVMSLRHKPVQDETTDRFVLPKSDEEADRQYLLRLDDETRLRRRVHEMMLATACQNLQELDGLVFNKSRILVKDDIWQRLLYLGVIRRSERAEAITEA
ncbi:hypothetical protein BDV96DRAFT_564992 [Lophiotrema nucula]|uniref:Septation initiation network scaffold protein cdc11 n=1 Tax=Lophiotrema nucula TaxID=690887 RepID=A0A6A5ZNP8_9PLEO|nr:hypothetical protein BDV96DRAFT_564992 [Lophiotrema nucula]